MYCYIKVPLDFCSWIDLLVCKANITSPLAFRWQITLPPDAAKRAHVAVGHKQNIVVLYLWQNILFQQGCCTGGRKNAGSLSAVLITPATWTAHWQGVDSVEVHHFPFVWKWSLLGQIVTACKCCSMLVSFSRWNQSNTGCLNSS